MEFGQKCGHAPQCKRELLANELGTSALKWPDDTRLERRRPLFSYGRGTSRTGIAIATYYPIIHPLPPASDTTAWRVLFLGSIEKDFSLKLVGFGNFEAFCS